MRIQPHSNPSPKDRGLTANTTLLKTRRIIPFFLLLLISLSAAAQGEQASSGLMRSHLKMYVVVGVLLIIFAGISLFLFSLERRLKKLEANSK